MANAEEHPVFAAGDRIMLAPRFVYAQDSRGTVVDVRPAQHVVTGELIGQHVLVIWDGIKINPGQNPQELPSVDLRRIPIVEHIAELDG